MARDKATKKAQVSDLGLNYGTYDGSRTRGQGSFPLPILFSRVR
ncbi:hypothetical protein YWIDRAFT_03504 [Streptomyces sp. SceaMP-e96]|nr:hypothetical protein YWIDRAFT_03504 [Streptomyces sp. SceaMP-e96]